MWILGDVYKDQLWGGNKKFKGICLEVVNAYCKAQGLVDITVLTNAC